MGFTDHKLKFTIDADGKAARTELADIDKMIGKVGSGLGSWAGPAAIAATGVAAIGAAALGASAALFELTKNAAEYGSTIYDASKKTGLHAEALSAMDLAAKQSGTSLEAITGGIAKFSKLVGEAADGSKEATAKLKEFGLAPQEAINDLDGALGKVFKRIIDAPPGIERMTLAQKAFGRAGADLLPFIDSFDGDLAGLIKRAKELGVTIDDKAAKAADDFGDQLDLLNAQLAGVGRTIGTELMPTFTHMATSVSGWLTQNQSEIHAWADTIGLAFSGAISAIGKFADFVKDHQTAIRIGLGIVSLGGSEASIRLGEGLAQLLIEEGQKVGGDSGGGAAGAGGRSFGSPTIGPGVSNTATTAPKTKVTNIAPASTGIDPKRAYEYQIKLAGEYFKNESEFFEAEARTRIAWGDYAVATGKKTEDDFARYRENLELGVMEYRKNLLADYFKELKPGSDEYKRAEQDLRILEQTIETERAANATNEANRKRKEIENEQKLRVVRNKSWNEYIQSLKAADDAKDEADAKAGRARYESGTVMGGSGIGGAIGQGIGTELVPMFDDATNSMLTFQERMNLVGADINNFVGSALGGLIEGLAQMGAAWLAGGDISAAAALQMVSAAAFSVATQAGFKAIFEFAEGLAAEATTFGVPNPSSIAHFAAAATYGTVAAIAGGVGVVAGLGARAAGGGSKASSGGRGSSSSSSAGQQQQVSPYSRQSDDVYISGQRNRDTAINNLTAEIKRLTTASPGDVLMLGSKQRKGFIGTQAVDDMKTRPQLGTRMLRQANAR